MFLVFLFSDVTIANVLYNLLPFCPPLELEGGRGCGFVSHNNIIDHLGVVLKEGI